MLLNCPTCNKVFETISPKKHIRKYCSAICRIIAWQRTPKGKISRKGCQQRLCINLKEKKKTNRKILENIARGMERYLFIIRD